MENKTPKTEQQRTTHGVMPRVCSYCGNDLSEEELEYPREDESGDIMCDNCYYDNYEEICPICENSYIKQNTPEETYFIVSKDTEKDAGIKAGVYQVLKYPVFCAATGGLGTTYMYPENYKLLRECDIDSMLNKLYGKGNYGHSINTNFCCPNCAERFSKTSTFNQIRTNWSDPFTKIHRNIYERGVIQHGV